MWITQIYFFTVQKDLRKLTRDSVVLFKSEHTFRNKQPLVAVYISGKLEVFVDFWSFSLAVAAVGAPAHKMPEFFQ